jgi:hypothetical protein
VVRFPGGPVRGGDESRKIAVLFNDITDRKHAEEELKKKHGDLNAAYEELTAIHEELRQTNDELLKNEHALKNRNEDLLAMNEAASPLLFPVPVPGNRLHVEDRVGLFFGKDPLLDSQVMDCPVLLHGLMGKLRRFQVPDPAGEHGGEDRVAPHMLPEAIRIRLDAIDTMHGKDREIMGQERQ